MQRDWGLCAEGHRATSGGEVVEGDENHVMSCGGHGIYPLVMTNIAMENPL